MDSSAQKWSNHILLKIKQNTVIKINDRTLKPDNPIILKPSDFIVGDFLTLDTQETQKTSFLNTDELKNRSDRMINNLNKIKEEISIILKKKK